MTGGRKRRLRYLRNRRRMTVKAWKRLERKRHRVWTRRSGRLLGAFCLAVFLGSLIWFGSFRDCAQKCAKALLESTVKVRYVREVVLIPGDETYITH